MTTNGIYLSPTTPRWFPTTEQEIQDAATAGILDETHYLDLKREIGPSKAANKELARDLAQFAIDGGALLVGVDEVPGGAPVLTPVTLAGLSERIEQVARQSVDPPLLVRTTTIPSGSATGYVLVQVPASAHAPHMVDGVYYGRGDRVRARLSDQEVRRLHRIQADQVDVARVELAHYVARDPIPADLRQQAHLFVVAIPISAADGIVLEVTHGSDAHQELYQLVQTGGSFDRELTESFAPSLRSAASFYRRPDGAALATGLGSGRVLESRSGGRFDEDVLEVELTEGGTVRLLTTRLSDGGPDQQQLFGTMMPILVRQLVGIASAVSARANYGGMWALGVAANGIKGLAVYEGRQGWGSGGRVSADLDQYERYTQASALELAQDPGAVAERLVGRFVRGAGIDLMPDVKKALA